MSSGRILTALEVTSDIVEQGGGGILAYASFFKTSGDMALLPTTLSWLPYWAFAHGFLNFFIGLYKLVTDDGQDNEVSSAFSRDAKAVFQMFGGVLLCAEGAMAVKAAEKMSLLAGGYSILLLTFVTLAINALVELVTALDDYGKALNEYSAIAMQSDHPHCDYANYCIKSSAMNLFAKSMAATAWLSLSCYQMLAILQLTGTLYMAFAAFGVSCLAGLSLIYISKHCFSYSASYFKPQPQAAEAAMVITVEPPSLSADAGGLP